MFQIKNWLVPASKYFGFLVCVSLISPVEIYADEIEEILVTARKRAENLQDVPVAVTAFQGNELKERDLSDISQISNFAPNVTLRPTASLSGASNASAFFIRGIGQTDFAITTEPGVGIYVDGVYVARSVGSVFETLDVESIEVLRGPQGTLFGRNTIGGAINVRTKKPGDDFNTEFKLTAGSYDRVDVAGALNIPINDKFKMRFSGLSQNSDGYVRRLATESSLQTSANIVSDKQGGDDTNTLRGSMLFDITDNVEFLLNFDSSRVREESAASTAAISSAGIQGVDAPPLIVLPPLTIPGLGAVSPGDPRLIPADIDTTYATGPNQTELDIGGVAGTITWDVNDLEIKSITSYRETDGNFNRDGDGTPFPIGEQTREIDYNQFTQELQIIGTSFDSRLDWTAGVFYLEEEATDLVTVTLGQIFPGLGIDIDNFVDNSSFAAFGQGTYHLTEKLGLTSGIRWTKDEKKYTTSQVVPPITFTIISGTAEDEFTDITGRGGLEYRWNDDLLTYFSAARGFKSGGFTPRYVLPVSAPLSFEPETVWTYEIGSKWQGLNDRAQLNLAVFLSDYEDIQLVLFDTGGAPINQNGGEATIWGIEAEGIYIFNDFFSLSGALGYTNAGFDAVMEPVGAIPFQPVTLNSEFPNTPELTVSISPRFVYPVSYGEFKLGMDLFYSTEFHQTFENDPELRQDSHTLLDASIAYTTLKGGTTITLGGHNITDERIIVSGGIGRVPGFGDRNFNRPAEVYLSVSQSFDF